MRGLVFRIALGLGIVALVGAFMLMAPGQRQPHVPATVSSARVAPSPVSPPSAPAPTPGLEAALGTVPSPFSHLPAALPITSLPSLTGTPARIARATDAIPKVEPALRAYHNDAFAGYLDTLDLGRHDDVNTLSNEAIAFIPYDAALALVERYGRLPDFDSYLDCVRPYLPRSISTVADVGAASGRLTPPLDRLINTPPGALYSVDSDTDAQVFREWYLARLLSYRTAADPALRALCPTHPIFAVQGRLDNPCLPRDGMDVIYCSRLGYYVSMAVNADPQRNRQAFNAWYRYMRDALRKPGGVLVTIDGDADIGSLEASVAAIEATGTLRCVARGRVQGQRWWWAVYRAR